MSETKQGGISPRVLRLTEGAVMLALATVLSLIKLIDLPYGGSVTAASSVPLILLSYRHGVGFGLFAGLAYGLLQLTFSSALSYVTGFWSVAAVVLLDYVVAFAAVGFAGAFRRMKTQSTALLWGTVLYSAIRYLLHVLSGATVWAGISVPTAAALVYSFGYNATYMIPETVIAAAGAYFLGSVLNFRRDLPGRTLTRTAGGHGRLTALAVGLVTAAVVYDTAVIFRHTQDAETGQFSFAGLTTVNWMPLLILTGAAVLAAIVLVLVIRKKKVADEATK